MGVVMCLYAQLVQTVQCSAKVQLYYNVIIRIKRHSMQRICHSGPAQRKTNDAYALRTYYSGFMVQI